MSPLTIDSLRSLLEESESIGNLGTFTWNIRNNRIDYSQNLLRIFGIGQEWVGAGDFLEYVLSIIHPEDQPAPEAFLSGQKQKQWEKEFRIILPNGDERILWGKLVTLDNDHIAGFIKDITTERIRHKELLLQLELMATAEKMTGTGTWKMDLETRHVEYSGNVLSLLGLSHTKPLEEIPSLLKAAILREDLNSAQPIIQRSLSNKEVFTVEYRLEKPGGAIRWVRSICCKYVGKTAYGFLQDITLEKEELQEKEGRLARESRSREQAEQQLETIFQSAPVGLFTLDKDLRYLRINTLMAKINGVPIDAHIGRTVDEVLPGLQAEIRKSFEKVLQGESVDGLITSSRLEGFANNFWLCSYHPLKIDGGVNGIVGVVQDISEIKRKEELLLSLTQELRDKQAKLNETLRSVTNQKERLLEFSQMVSHNLRGPVSGMVGLAPLLREAANRDEWLEYLTLMDSCIHKLSDSLDTLTDALKVQMHMDIQVNEVDINETIDNVLGLFMSSIQLENIRINRELSVEKIKYNKEYLEAIVTNLVSNAIKYRKPSEPPQIHIKTWEENGIPFMSIRDQGLGIDLERHGNNMFKLSKTFHGNKDAKGVGLFMIKSQVDAMGGTVTVKSNPGEFTEFIIDLSAPKDK